jgi:hypothetical protein
VKRGRDGKQELTRKVEEKPSCEHAYYALKELDSSSEVAASCRRFAKESSEARGAEDAVVMLRNAFATEKMPALGASGCRFTLGVVVTTLGGQVFHLRGHGQD